MSNPARKKLSEFLTRLTRERDEIYNSAALVSRVLDAMSATKSPMIELNAERVARYEALGWRANYAHNWFYVFYLVVQLLREQFGMNVSQALRASYYVARASAAWVPLDHNLEIVRIYLVKFYQLAQRASRRSFDPIQLANLELQYWIIHRELSGKPDKRELVRALAELHAGLFGTSVEAMLPSAENRAAAATTVDLITSKQSQDVEADYRRVEEYLRVAYRQVNEALMARADAS